MPTIGRPIPLSDIATRAKQEATRAVEEVNRLRKELNLLNSVPAMESAKDKMLSELDLLRQKIDEAREESEFILVQSYESVEKSRAEFEEFKSKELESIRLSADQAIERIASRERELSRLEKDHSARNSELDKKNSDLLAKEAILKALEQSNHKMLDRLDKSSIEVDAWITACSEKERILSEKILETDKKRRDLDQMQQAINEADNRIKEEAMTFENAKLMAFKAVANATEAENRAKGEQQRAIAILESLEAERRSIEEERNEFQAKLDQGARQERLLRDMEETQSAREARILQIEARTSEEQRQIEYARERVRQDYLVIEQKRRELDRVKEDYDARRS